jgi:2-keto-4-pentenoate hydratase
MQKRKETAAAKVEKPAAPDVWLVLLAADTGLGVRGAVVKAGSARAGEMIEAGAARKASARDKALAGL